MGYLELYKKDILDLVNTGKTTEDFNPAKGDYIKVEVYKDASPKPLGIFYSNRLLLRYNDADEYYVGDYHYKPGVGFVEGYNFEDGTNNVLSPIPVGSTNEPLNPDTVYKKQLDIFKDDSGRIYIKPNEILKLLKLSKNKYRIRIDFLRNIKSELSNFLFSNKNNLIENGNFFAGLEATQTGDLDRSVGKNNFTRMNNPGLSQYVLEQNGIVGNYYNMKVTGIKPSTNYIFSCWVAWDSEFNGLKYVNLSTTFGNASSNSEASGFSKTENEFGVIIDGASTNVTINGINWTKMYCYVLTNENANLGSINIYLGKGSPEDITSTKPLGKRFYTDLRFEEVESFEGEILERYINNLKNKNMELK